MKLFSVTRIFWLFLCVALTGSCMESPESHQRTEKLSEAASEQAVDTGYSDDFMKARTDNAKRRINEVIERIRLRTESLELWMAKDVDFSGQARLRSADLHQDLERLEAKLQQSLDSLTKYSAETADSNTAHVKARLEQVEDELAQIQEEMSEWYDENIK